MKHIIWLSVVILLASCSKDLPIEPTVIPQPIEEYSSINKTTGWYVTNKLFGGRNFFIDSSQTYRSLYTNGSEVNFTYNSNNTNYFSNRQGLFYGDLNGDGKNDVFNNYWASPFGTNKPGYYVTWEYDKQGFSKPNIQKGLTGARKLVLNDYYKNGKVGILVCSGGADLPPFYGDSVHIISFNGDLSMNIQTMSDKIGYYHSGCSGDFDNDGDVDILLYSAGGYQPIGPVYYQNQGNGNFKYIENFINGIGYSNNNPNNYYTFGTFDLNADGYLDILLLGGSKSNMVSRILWGSQSHTYSINNQTIIPNPADNRTSIMDVAFSDIDGDKDIDLILNYEINNKGFGIRILENRNNEFADATDNRVDVSYKENSTWFGWIRLFDVDRDGDKDIVADGIGYLQNQNGPGNQPIPNIQWINNGGKYVGKFSY